MSISEHLILDREGAGIMWSKVETLASPFSYLVKIS